MKRVLGAIGLGVLGVAFALALTIGALAVAGPDVGEAPTIPVLDQEVPPPSPSSSPSHEGRNGDDDRSGGKNDDRTSPQPTVSPSTDHQAGSSDDGSGDDSGSEDHGSESGSEEHEEPDDD